jgi:hypothetical protein
MPTRKKPLALSKALHMKSTLHAGIAISFASVSTAAILFGENVTTGFSAQIQTSAL